MLNILGMMQYLSGLLKNYIIPLDISNELSYRSIVIRNLIVGGAR